MSECDDVRLSTPLGWPHDEAALIDAGLGLSNDAGAPISDVQRLSCFARLPSGLVIGGAVGRIWGGCCELQQFWVDPARRRQGIGTRLVREFERFAADRGCCTFYLETYSFQAPALYRRLGYETKLEIRGFPGGIAKYTMVRQVNP